MSEVKADVARAHRMGVRDTLTTLPRIGAARIGAMNSQLLGSWPPINCLALALFCGSAYMRLIVLRRVTL